MDLLALGNIISGIPQAFKSQFNVELRLFLPHLVKIILYLRLNILSRNNDLIRKS